MTIDERFERIEQVTAGLAEDRRKDREEFRSLWQDTQRQLNDVTGKIADLGDRIARSPTNPTQRTSARKSAAGAWANASSRWYRPHGRVRRQPSPQVTRGSFPTEYRHRVFRPKSLRSFISQIFRRTPFANSAGRYS